MSRARSSMNRSRYIRARIHIPASDPSIAEADE